MFCFLLPRLGAFEFFPPEGDDLEMRDRSGWAVSRFLNQAAEKGLAPGTDHRVGAD